MPVPSIAILKFLSIARNFYGWPLLKLDMLILYVSDVAYEGFLLILTLMMFCMCCYYKLDLVWGIGGGSMQACISLLSHGPFFMVYVLILLIWSC